MNGRVSYLEPQSRVCAVFGLLPRWSIIDLYRTADVLPSVAECVLQNMRLSTIANQVGETPKNRWGISYPIFEFKTQELRNQAFRQRHHSHCWVSDKAYAGFPDNYAERPTYFRTPKETSVFSEYLERESVYKFESEWIAREKSHFVRHHKVCGMYEDTVEAERVYNWYVAIYATLLTLWELELESVTREVLFSPELSFTLTSSVGHLLLAGRHHEKHVLEALKRWYASPLVTKAAKAS